jgi:hypothetical protein
VRNASPLVVPARLTSAVLAGALLLSGCGVQDEPAAAASTTGSNASDDGGAAASTTTAEDAESGADGSSTTPPFPADTSADTGEASADALVTVTDIRIGRHDGFDRVVLDVEGTGTPGWDVRYVDQASSQGSGDPVEVAGEAVLQVTVTGAGYPFDTGVDEYAQSGPLSAAGTEVVTEVVFDATYEGTTVAFIGTAAEAPFRVQLLENPTRVVVDVRDPG